MTHPYFIYTGNHWTKILYLSLPLKMCLLDLNSSLIIVHVSETLPLPKSNYMRSVGMHLRWINKTTDC